MVVAVTKCEVLTEPDPSQCLSKTRLLSPFLFIFSVRAVVGSSTSAVAAAVTAQRQFSATAAAAAKVVCVLYPDPTTGTHGAV